MASITYGGIFQSTFQGLERGLWVEHIATFDLRHCDPSDTIDGMAIDAALKGIDCIPVRLGGQVIGVVDRTREGIAGAAREVMEPLSERILVEARTPLKDFLPQMRQPPYYRLVLKGTSVAGIVTRSDVQKLPVRILAFGLVTHLEMSMANLIALRFPGESKWKKYLSQSRQDRLEKEVGKLKSSRLEVSDLEAAQFCDKRDIVAGMMGLGPVEVDELKKIELVARNPLAHAGNFTKSNSALKEFLQRLAQAESWIARIEAEIAGLR